MSESDKLYTCQYFKIQGHQKSQVYKIIPTMPNASQNVFIRNKPSGKLKLFYILLPRVVYKGTLKFWHQRQVLFS